MSNNLKTSYFTYKGLPLVRNKDEIYFGNMSDKYVIRMQILEKTEKYGIQVASKIKIYQISTDLKLNPVEAIKKTSEKESLYEALDLAWHWLDRASKGEE